MAIGTNTMSLTQQAQARNGTAQSLGAQVLAGPRPTSTARDAATIRAACRCDNPRCACHRDGGNVHCRAHDDKSPSLSVDVAADGKLLVKCRAHCSQEEVITALKSRGAWPSSVRADSYTDRTAKATSAPRPKAQPKPKPLLERGLTTKTLRRFRVAVVNSQQWKGWKYPTHHPDGTEGRPRFKNARAKSETEEKYQWWRGGDGEQPAGYNIHNIPDGTPEVWAVGGEMDVWTMDQNGFIAASTFGETQGAEAFVKALIAKKVGILHIALDADDAGRTGAWDLAESCEDQGLPYTVYQFEGELGHDVNDEFQRQGCDQEAFRAAMLGLAKVDAATLATWAAQVKAKLPVLHAEPKAKADIQFTTDLDLDEALGNIEWLWPEHIPKGFVTGIVGEQDEGKSTVAQALCNIVLQGGHWPDGQAYTADPDTKIPWIDTEGSLALLLQRQKAWGGPRGRFILPPNPLQELAIDNSADWEWIEGVMEKFKPPMIVIDALSGAHRHGKENGNDEMKPIMKKLAALAQHYGTCVLPIHHLNKPAPGAPSFPVTIHRLRGAGAIPQYCRSILAVGRPDPANPDSRRMDVIKLNLCRKPEPVGYVLTDHGPAWGPAPELPRPRRAVDDAIDFLRSALATGPRAALEVEEEAKAHKIGDTALKSAKAALKVRAEREGGTRGRWFWFPQEFRVVQGDVEEGGI